MKLQGEDQVQWDIAISRNNIAGAAKILEQAGQIDDAIQWCVDNAAYNDALDIAVKHDRFDYAIPLCKKLNDQDKLAEILILKGDKEQAALLLTSLQQYERAAKIFFGLKQYDKAALLYAKMNQFMNAVMCYQKSGDTAKQLEMQINAFEYDLKLANGDLQAVNVSRMMAVYAARSYLDQEETRMRGLQVLKKADDLLDSAHELEKEQKFLQAGYCYEYAQKLPEALNAYIQGNHASQALALCSQIGDEDLEIKTLMRFNQVFKAGQKLAIQKRYQEALDVLQSVDTDSRDYANAVELQGDIQCKLKNFGEAILCYESLYWLSLPPERVCRIAFKAGYSCESVADLPNALKNYQRVFDINPDFHDVGNVINTLKERLKHRSSSQLFNNNTYRQSSALQNSMIRQSGCVLRTNSRHRTRTNSVVIGETEVPIIDFDRYHVVEEVAHGGMGVVYKATDTILLRTVALKVLAQKLKDNQVALEYFMREARASAQLTHINIVTVYDVGSLNDGTVYMAMEYIDGKTLKQIVSQTGAFPTKFLVQIAMHACRGLQYAHDHAIIHRDVKSSNMMLAKRDKTLKILDLGLAKVVTEQDRNSTQAIGTPYYMSPEQVLGNEIDCRSDIYSLGVTLYELATGVLPFTKGDLAYKHIHELPPRPSTFNPEINPVVEEIILKMMQKKPDDRFASCNEVSAALKTVDYRAEEAKREH